MIRHAAALLANRLARGRVWWCAHCGGFAPPDDLHDYEVEGGGAHNRCVADGHAAGHCARCSQALRGGRRVAWPSRTAWLLRVPAALANLARLKVCHFCGDLGVPGRGLHVDDDPERRYICRGCELEAFDAPHGREGCPLCGRIRRSLQRAGEAA